MDSTEKVTLSTTQLAVRWNISRFEIDGELIGFIQSFVVKQE
jgi:hypothetical protein